jgi:lysozyme family protein
VNSTGQSGNAVDSGGKADEPITMKTIKGWSAKEMRKKMKNPKHRAAIDKVLKERQQPK